ncbi:Tim21p [Cyberlindnera jadinii NRRL Y-1542]|uniref:Mitochondrial import inner membrane translocase subunit Tim21 n=1 Tax=Cyberlindnera jadinii (strain ATCC 18201 / CBS 1600 / BCRC 20928 / JCM 3617 / NBRC 0987 / NRRL Y-1542) TaxID=983966 RepID=A0A1E4S0J2_CYBJN|nr:TIM21-domain-containing protein [Cyberlindnera jadinii NRRL Y-1542]ODV72991.1 TIM21-domain-containing protein [Cyberlindnera jadinii NRRL Y-1542]
MLLRSSLSTVCVPVRSIGLCNYPRAFSTVQRGLLQQTTKTSESKDSKSDKIPLWARIKTASTFAFASTVVVGAAGLAGLVIYLVVAEIVLPSGDTQVFNKAVSMVETDPKAQELLLLEPGKRLKAYGETTDNKWTRNRPISSTRRMDKSGKEHLFMRFHVESKQRHGSVQLESIHDDVLHPEYSYIYLDVPGEKRHYIIAPPQPKLLGSRDPNAGFLGVRWGPKTD